MLQYVLLYGGAENLIIYYHFPDNNLKWRNGFELSFTNNKKETTRRELEQDRIMPSKDEWLKCLESANRDFDMTMNHPLTTDDQQLKQQIQQFMQDVFLSSGVDFETLAKK